MSQISRFSLHLLRNGELQTFNRRVLAIIEQTCGPCGAAYEQFKLAAQNLEKAIHLSKPSMTLDSFDQVADAAWYGLFHQLKASALHPEEAVREAASKVSELFDQEPNPTRLSFDEEYAALHRLLARLSTLDSDTSLRAGVAPYIEQLSVSVASFERAAEKKIEDSAKFEASQVKNAVMASREAWRKLARHITVMVELDQLPKGDLAVSQLNAMNKMLKQRLEQRAKRNEPNAPNEDDQSLFSAEA